MAGYNLPEGQYDTRSLSQDELWAAFSNLFSVKSRNDTSYKFGFLKAIIDNLYNVDGCLVLTFNQLFSKFAEIYWNLILKHGLRQKSATYDNRETYIEQVLHAASNKYNIIDAIPYERLSPQMMREVSHQVKMKCKKYVVGALYEDTNHIFYSFSKKEEWIRINPIMYEFLCKHRLVIEKLNYYEWAKFLERVNEDPASVKLLNKIDESDKRNNLSVYRQILFNEFESKTCFYCGKPLNSDRTDVDHFIPWSFIKDDQLWNLVLACPSCNRRKNDRLPTQEYLVELLDRNEQIIVACPQYDMSNYNSNVLRSVYYWAQINGYNNLWRPKI